MRKRKNIFSVLITVVVLAVIFGYLSIKRAFILETTRVGENIVEFTDYYYGRDGSLLDYDYVVTDGRDEWETLGEVLNVFFNRTKSSSWENVYQRGFQKYYNLDVNPNNNTLIASKVVFTHFTGDHITLNDYKNAVDFDYHDDVNFVGGNNSDGSSFNISSFDNEGVIRQMKLDGMYDKIRWISPIDDDKIIAGVSDSKDVIIVDLAQRNTKKVTLDAEHFAGAVKKDNLYTISKKTISTIRIYDLKDFKLQRKTRLKTVLDFKNYDKIKFKFSGFLN